MHSVQQLFQQSVSTNELFGEVRGKAIADEQQAGLRDAASRKGDARANEASYSVDVRLSSMSSLQQGRHVFAQELAVRLSFSANFFSSDTRLPGPVDKGYAVQPVFEPPSPVDVADRIVGFVEKRLQAERSEGAGQDRMSELLSQARTGVEKGFSQARDQLDQMGLMSDTLSDEIDQSFKLTNEGLDQLDSKYTGREAEPEKDQLVTNETVRPEAGNATRAPADKSVSESWPGEARAGYEQFTGFSDQMRINVQTRDGDVVTVYLGETGARLSSAGFTNGSGGMRSDQFTGLAYQNRYQLQIDGELDEGEIQALNKLFAQADALAGEFFAGNYQEAFQSALDLNMDSSELASFSMTLTQTQVRQVSAYEQFSGQSEKGDGGQTGFRNALPAQKAIHQLNQLTSRLMDMLDSARPFKAPADLVEDTLARALSSGKEDANALPVDHLTSFAREILKRL